MKSDNCFDSHLINHKIYNFDNLLQENVSNIKECIRCVNNSLNPTISFDENGLCSICQMFNQRYDPYSLEAELTFLKNCIGKGLGKYDVMIGMSGGKDSSATAYLVKQLGFTPLGFTFDIGYYPKHIFSRAKSVAETIGIEHTIIDIRKYISPSSLLSYQKTADLYELEDSCCTSQKFRRLYTIGRNHYSVKDTKPLGYVRVCQLCRKTFITALYSEAIKHNVSLIVLGLNEWTGLSQNLNSNKYLISGIRKLNPYPHKPVVYIAHLPFILSLKRSNVEAILKKIDWQVPSGEAFIESNSNSCLLARAAESKAFRLLGFHPDTTRLAREVTVGFLSKEEAKKALENPHPHPKSVRRTLLDAGILHA